MKDKKPIKTFIIQNKITKQQWKASSGKTTWKAVNHAKAAFANTYDCCLRQNIPIELQQYFQANKYHDVGTLYFDIQDVYEIVELKSETMIAVENLVGIFKSIKDNNFELQEQDKEFIADFIVYYGG